MDDKLLNILQSKEVPIENQQMIDYLKGQLHADTRHQLEEQALGDPFIQDSLDGLQLIADKTNLEAITKDLQRQLQKKLRSKKEKHREIRKWKDQNWIILSIITLLLLIIICYIVVKMKVL